VNAPYGSEITPFEFSEKLSVGPEGKEFQAAEIARVSPENARQLADAA